MKKTALVLFFALALFSCKKESKEFPENPDWLKTKISQMQTPVEYAGTVIYAYECNKEYCSCSSSSPRAISAKGDTLHIWANDVTTDYYKEKFCRQLVWKAPKYKDSPW